MGGSGRKLPLSAWKNDLQWHKNRYKMCTEALLSLEFGKLSVRMEIYVKVFIEGIDQRFTSHPLKENERIAVWVAFEPLGI